MEGTGKLVGFGVGGGLVLCVSGGRGGREKKGNRSEERPGRGEGERRGREKGPGALPGHNADPCLGFRTVSGQIVASVRLLGSGNPCSTMLSE